MPLPKADCSLMIDFLFVLIALIWFGGVGLRIYRQARFYQIEEYMSVRYARWWLNERERWLPRRPLIAWFISAPLGVVFSEGGAVLPGLISVTCAIIGVWPPREKEVKRPFRRTARATRLLAAAVVTAAVILVLLLWLTKRLPLPNFQSLQFTIVGFAGLLLYLAAPLLLMAGNLVLTPVEALVRRRFIQQARHVLAEVRPTVIGVTGSYGKTTTKVFLTDILNGRFKAYATPKSYNTMMGVCLAINNDMKNDYSIDYFIVEMGAYVRGEIERICDLTPPRIGVMVEVGPQHLERFGTLDNTAAAKYELIKALPPDGIGVFNWDNPYIREMYERGYPATRLAVSKTIAPDSVTEDGPRFVASDIRETLDGLEFTVTDRQTHERQTFRTNILGQHNITNILLATAVAIHEGMTLRDVALRVRQLQPAESRLVRQTTLEGITIINDAYSANPDGIIGALQVLGLHTTGKRLLITPGMVELGDRMAIENHKLGQLAAQHATDVILVGEKQAAPIRAGLRAAGFQPDRLHVVPTLAEAVDWYKHHLRAGDTVLFLNDLPDTY
jgi:UDP-N-acetylmuramoyl-tripeptide--D-alanyl-D-alanine ligase